MMVTVIYDIWDVKMAKTLDKLGWNHHVSSVIMLNWSLVFFRNRSCVDLFSSIIGIVNECIHEDFQEFQGATVVITSVSAHLL